jgi:hypothetical protein
MSFPLRPTFGLPIVLLAAAFGVSPVSHAADTASGGQCSVMISSPANGDSVVQSGTVSGQASIPEGRYLWVFAHPKGFDGWWPQGAGAASIGEGSWQVMVFYGSRQDVGSSFEVVAMPVDGKINDNLREWYATANAKGDFTPIRLPHTASGCQAAKVTVRRTS